MKVSLWKVGINKPLPLDISVSFSVKLLAGTRGGLPEGLTPDARIIYRMNARLTIAITSLSVLLRHSLSGGAYMAAVLDVLDASVSQSLLPITVGIFLLQSPRRALVLMRVVPL